MAERLTEEQREFPHLAHYAMQSWSGHSGEVCQEARNALKRLAGQRAEIERQRELVDALDKQRIELGESHTRTVESAAILAARIRELEAKLHDEIEAHRETAAYMHELEARVDERADPKA